MTETWKPIVGYEDAYSVSDQGRVKRTGAAKGGRVGTILKPRPTRKGYFRVSLCGRDFAIHRLVLEAFCGPPPDDETQGNHRNGDKSDNTLANLEWATPSENQQHALRTGLRTPARGAANGRAKLTADQAAEIRAARGRERQVDTAARFGISDVRVSQIQRGIGWRP